MALALLFHWHICSGDIALVSGHCKFSELTKKFTPEDWCKIEEIKAEMRVPDTLEIQRAKRDQHGNA